MENQIQIKSKRSRTFWLSALIALVVIATFHGVSQNDFVQWDDDIQIYANPHIAPLDAKALRWMFTDVSYTPRYRPLNWLSWSVTYALFGANPKPYHVIDLLLHVANAILVFWLLRKILDAAFRNKIISLRAIDGCATLAALIWAIHPLRVETVAWANGRLYTQSLFFLLISVLLYFESAQNKKPFRSSAYWFSVLFFVFSTLTYPTGIGFVFLLVILDIIVLQRLPSNFTQWPGKASRRIWLEKIPFVAVTFFVVVITFWARTHASGIWFNASLEEFSVSHRVAQAFYIYAYFLWKPWWPLELSPVYTQLISFRPTDWPFLFSTAGIILISALIYIVRRRWPGLPALWIAYLIVLLPMLGLTEHPHYSSDRYSYIASILWSVLIAFVLLKIWNKKSLRAVSIAVLICLVSALCVLSANQVKIWKDSPTLFRYVIAQLKDDPYRHDPHYRLGLFFGNQGRLDEAIAEFDHALRIKPGFSLAHFNRAVALHLQNHLDEAAADYQQTIQFDPNHAEAYNNLARVFLVQKKFDAAVRCASEAVRLLPDYSAAHFVLGNALFASGSFSNATAHYEEALRLKPDFSEAEQNLRVARYNLQQSSQR